MIESGNGESLVLLLTRDGMGDAPLELRQKLLHTYLNLLMQNNTLPAAICFYGRGVHMVVEGSPVLDPLRALEGRGVRLVICSTCLGYFGLVDRVRVGVVGGMGDILEAQWKADKVITL